MTIGVDSKIYDRAEATAKADHPEATADDVRELAEAWQRAYEDWALAREPHQFLADAADAPRVGYGEEDVTHCLICGQAEDRPIHRLAAEHDAEIAAIPRGQVQCNLCKEFYPIGQRHGDCKIHPEPKGA